MKIVVVGPGVIGSIYGSLRTGSGHDERYLSEQFPDSYPKYGRSTKMLVPFIC
jgi:protein-S-isoprenylcysteine O-methyltransferase Ste14